MATLMVYFGLFLLALGAATLLPLQSEAGLVVLLLTDNYNVAALLLVAIAGNTLGSMINWWLGRELVRFQPRRDSHGRPTKYTPGSRDTPR